MILWVKKKAVPKAKKRGAIRIARKATERKGTGRRGSIRLMIGEKMNKTGNPLKNIFTIVRRVTPASQGSGGKLKEDEKGQKKKQGIDADKAA